MGLLCFALPFFLCFVRFADRLALTLFFIRLQQTVVWPQRLQGDYVRTLLPNTVVWQDTFSQESLALFADNPLDFHVVKKAVNKSMENAESFHGFAG
jgi:hypothetical protein